MTANKHNCYLYLKYNLGSAGLAEEGPVRECRGKSAQESRIFK